MTPHRTSLPCLQLLISLSDHPQILQGRKCSVLVRETNEAVLCVGPILYKTFEAAYYCLLAQDGSPDLGEAVVAPDTHSAMRALKVFLNILNDLHWEISQVILGQAANKLGEVISLQLAIECVLSYSQPQEVHLKKLQKLKACVDKEASQKRQETVVLNVV